VISVAADPNWFYSTLAQSTAALVGLAGAFLLQRLLSQRQEVAITRRSIREECLLLRRHMQEEAEVARGPLDGLETAIRDADREPPECDVISVPMLNITVFGSDGTSSGQVGLPEFDRSDGLRILGEALESLNAYVEALEAATFERMVEDLRQHGRLRRPDRDWLEDGKRDLAVQIAEPRPTIWARLETQHRNVTFRWKQFSRQSEEIGDRLGRLRTRFVPQSFYMLFVVLLLMLGAGVVAPLVFLSAQAGPSKWILFALFTPLSVAFVGFFGWELRSLRRADRLLKEAF
jgi:hypothetical protein